MSEINSNLGGSEDPRCATAKLMSVVEDQETKQSLSDPFPSVLEVIIIAMFNSGPLELSKAQQSKILLLLETSFALKDAKPTLKFPTDHAIVKYNDKVTSRIPRIVPSKHVVRNKKKICKHNLCL
ncbi:unnamed protein product [Mucor hiemalis]